MKAALLTSTSSSPRHRKPEDFQSYLRDIIEIDEDIDDNAMLQSNHRFEPPDDWVLGPPHADGSQERWRNSIRQAYRLKNWQLHIADIDLVLRDSKQTEIARLAVYRCQPYVSLTRGRIEEYFRSRENATGCLCVVGVAEVAEDMESASLVIRRRSVPDDHDRLDASETTPQQELSANASGVKELHGQIGHSDDGYNDGFSEDEYL